MQQLRSITIFLTSLVVLFACTPSAEVSVTFTDAKGLREGDTVFLEDREVGKVETVVTQDGKAKVKIALNMDKTQSLRERSAAMIVQQGNANRVELYNYRAGKKPLTPGMKLIGLNSGFEYAAWQAGEAIDYMQFGFAQAIISLQRYMESDEWNQNKQRMRDQLLALEAATEDTVKDAREQFEELIEDLESQSRETNERIRKGYDELVTTMREQMDKLVQEDYQGLLVALQQMLQELGNLVEQQEQEEQKQ